MWCEGANVEEVGAADIEETKLPTPVLRIWGKCRPMSPAAPHYRCLQRVRLPFSARLYSPLRPSAWASISGRVSSSTVDWISRCMLPLFDFISCRILIDLRRPQFLREWPTDGAALQLSPIEVACGARQGPHQRATHSPRALRWVCIARRASGLRGGLALGRAACQCSRRCLAHYLGSSGGGRGTGERY